MHNHELGFRADRPRALASHVGRTDPGEARRPPPEDPRDFFLLWMDRAEADDVDAPGEELPFCEFERTYWHARKEPWMLFVHYADLKADLVGEMQRVSDFLEIETSAALMPRLAEAAAFETMKQQGDEMIPMLRQIFDRGADRFINQGLNGRWKHFLTDADVARYEALVRRKLSQAHAAWLERGRLAAGEPRDLPD